MAENCVDTHIFWIVRASAVIRIRVKLFLQAAIKMGVPVLEPPILDYFQWIGEEYDKACKEVLKWTCGDVAQTTKIFDIDNERDLLTEF